MSESLFAACKLRALILRYMPEDEAVPSDGPQTKALHALADLLSSVERVATDLESHAVIAETQDLTISPATVRSLAQRLTAEVHRA